MGTADAPRCSVIIPVFNSAKYAPIAVASALAQTYTNREVIVVNDGSTDQTASVLRPFMPDIVYIEQPHRGVSAARNRALEAARGELIAFLDADDAWGPNWLETAIRSLDDQPDADFVTHQQPRRPVFRRFRRSNQGFWITQYNFVSYMSVVPRRLLEKYGGFDEELIAWVDWELWIRLLTNGLRVAECAPAPTLHRRSPSSLTGDFDQNLLFERRMFERIVEKNGIGKFGPRLAIARGKAAMVEGDFATARRQFAAALLGRPLAGSLRLVAIPSFLSPRLALRARRANVARTRRRGQRRARRRSEAGEFTSLSA